MIKLKMKIREWLGINRLIIEASKAITRTEVYEYSSNLITDISDRFELLEKKLGYKFITIRIFDDDDQTFKMEIKKLDVLVPTSCKIQDGDSIPIKQARKNKYLKEYL